jgi:ribosomal protein S18 acetylase RimI-like enzyme
MSINIRDAGPEDAAAIVRLIAELGGQSPVTKEYVESYLSFPGSGVLLAEEGDQTIGLLSYSVRPNLYHAGDSCLIEELIVHEPARGRGVGSALMSELFRRLISTGCAEVSVSTMPGNQRAIKFYKYHGLIDEAILLEKHFG